ncbi:uncharacterized protein [Battus philenor]|uniref:uncharacterized protein n=1 Tax=Battus philenor TaxID=42288 RepID=UPI0035CE86D9
MQKGERWSEEKEPEGGKSRPTSRRSSASLSRRGSKEEKETRRGVNTAPNSTNSTPKRLPKSQNFDLVVTGKQIFKRPDRASSLPGTHRRPSLDSIPKQRRTFDSPKRFAMSQSSQSRDTFLDEDMSLELSQVSDFEDMNSKYGVKSKFTALATSTPKPRSGSLQSQPLVRELPRRGQRSFDYKPSRQSTISCSRDSLYKTSSSSQYRQGVSTELDCSSVSPEYSIPSSVDSMGAAADTLVSPRSQDLNDSSCCVSTWQEGGSRGPRARGSDGEWAHFWACYNGPPSRALYDHCPTPYRSEDLDFLDFEYPNEATVKRSPEKLTNISEIIKTEGLHLTAKETQYIMKCTHILGSVVSKAIERRSNEIQLEPEKIQEIENVDEKETKKKTLTLDLKETNQPAEVKEEKKWETVTTQTDISLPNTKSAPKIFEKILRQLSKSSLEESAEKKTEQNEKQEEKDDNKPES